MPILHFSPPVIAHRGASGYAPENTLAAFAKAKACGARWVEFDVQLTADQEVVIFHDDLLQRTSNGQGPLSQQTYAQLQTLDAGSWFDVNVPQSIPRLRTVLQFLQQENMAANIELKPLLGQEEILAARVAEECRALQCLDSPDILFSSFSIPALQALRQVAPHALLGLLMDTWFDEWPTVCAALDCVSVHVNYHVLNKVRAAAIKSMQKYLLCYTVNDPKLALTLFAQGVDAVFSDYPDRIHASA